MAKFEMLHTLEQAHTVIPRSVFLSVLFILPVNTAGSLEENQMGQLLIVWADSFDNTQDVVCVFYTF